MACDSWAEPHRKYKDIKESSCFHPAHQPVCTNFLLVMKGSTSWPAPCFHYLLLFLCLVQLNSNFVLPTCSVPDFGVHAKQKSNTLNTFISYLPNRFAMTPTLNEPTMPPTLKMATATLQTMVQTPRLIGSPYRSIQVSLKKDLSFWRQEKMNRWKTKKKVEISRSQS